MKSKYLVVFIMFIFLIGSVSIAAGSGVFEFVKKISNIPSPTSNLKYITQTRNVFEVKYGDGSFSILSNDTYPLRLFCDDGSSMLPAFDCDDKIILKEVEEKSELNIGDIILFEFMDKKIIHRIVAMDYEQYWTRADNFDNTLKFIDKEIDFDDPPIKFENILYKVVGIIYN